MRMLAILAAAIVPAVALAEVRSSSGGENPQPRSTANDAQLAKSNPKPRLGR